MSAHLVQRESYLPISLEEAWDFFSQPGNLPLITPQWLSLQLTNEVPERMYPGLTITYKIKPLLGIPIQWVTEITHVKELEMFVDEQKIGPYAFWHHQHFFREVTGGVEMRDVVTYCVPFGLFGDVANKLIVRGRLEEIFTYRKQVTERLFGSSKDR